MSQDLPVDEDERWRFEMLAGVEREARLFIRRLLKAAHVPQAEAKTVMRHVKTPRADRLARMRRRARKASAGRNAP
jgi:hypothetical protein